MKTEVRRAGEIKISAKKWFRIIDLVCKMFGSDIAKVIGNNAAKDEG